MNSVKCVKQPNSKHWRLVFIQRGSFFFYCQEQCNKMETPHTVLLVHLIWTLLSMNNLKAILVLKNHLLSPLMPSQFPAGPQVHHAISLAQLSKSSSESWRGKKWIPFKWLKWKAGRNGEVGVPKVTSASLREAIETARRNSTKVINRKYISGDFFFFYFSAEDSMFLVWH